MSLMIFKRPYILRRFTKQKVVNGRPQARYKDILVMLDVQPLSSKELMTLPEGDRAVKRIKAFGSEKIRTADEAGQTLADRVFYEGNWHECTSSDNWDHTLLKHYETQFVLCAPNDQMKAPRKKPVLPGKKVKP